MRTRRFVEGFLSKARRASLTLACDKRGYVVRVDAGGKDSYRMQGPAYFDRRFSSRYLSILEEEYDKPITEGVLNAIYAEHVSELPMRMKEYSPEVIHEFDYVSDLCAFDVDFFANVDSHILDNICSTLECERLDISQVEPVSAGLTNLSVRFSCKGETYIYRHPGAGTGEIINREAEAYSLGVAKELGLDGTFVHEDAEAGWKISRFVPDCVEFDYKNEPACHQGPPNGSPPS